MLFRSTLAIETRLSSFRPSVPRSTLRFRPCLLSQLPGSRGLTLSPLLHLAPKQHSSDVAVARSPEVDDAGDCDASQSPDSPSFESLKDVQKWDSSYEASRSRHELSGNHFTRWKRAFSDIFHGTDAERTRTRNTMLRTEQRVAALRFASRRNPEQIRGRYRGMSENTIRKQIPDILVGCLLTGAELTLRVLEGLPPLTEDFTIRMDCLLMLRRDPELWSEIENRHRGHELKSQFYEQLNRQRDHGQLPKFALLQGHAALILEESTTVEQGERFFEKYLATYSDRESLVLLKFVDFFTKWEKSQHALDTLRHISPDEIKACDRLLLQRCTNLLKLDTIDTHGEAKNFKILPRLLELGIKPDTFIHNMIIMNAIKAQVPRVGWDLYEYLKVENLETDAVTHLLLMKDAFAREDVSGLNKILTAIYNRQDLYVNPYLVGCTMNIIRIIYTYQKHASPTNTFSHILSIHNRAWNPNIYVSLNMISPHAVTLQYIRLKDPPPRALAWTIFQYCLTQRNASPIDRLWTYLTHAISISDPQILAAATHETLYSGFIVFYGRNPRTLGKAVDIVQYMLDSPHCQPTGRIWMQLMCAYLRQGQQQQAEQIRRAMRQRGISVKGKEFAYLLERWPETEVAARARLAIAGQDVDFDEDMLDEELFEGVPMPGKSSPVEGGATGSAIWEGILDLRKQGCQAID